MASHSAAVDFTWNAVSQGCSDVFTKQLFLYFCDILTMTNKKEKRKEKRKKKKETELLCMNNMDLLLYVTHFDSTSTYVPF